MPKRNTPPIHPVLRIIRFMFASLGPVFPGFFAKRAYNMWFTTHRYKTPAAEQKAMQSAQQSTINITGIDVAVWSWGEGKPVLFMHGWSGRGTQVASFIEPLTRTGYRVISYDAPAHGETDGKQTSIFQVYDVVMALHEMYGPFHATITHSFGGMLLAYAMSSGLSTDRAVVICPPADIESLLGNFQRMLALPDNVILLMKQRLYTMYGLGLKTRLTTINNVRDLDCPSLVIHDEDDTDLPWQDGKRITDAWPGAEFVLTRGLGHRRILRDAATINRAVEFIIKGRSE